MRQEERSLQGGGMQKKRKPGNFARPNKQRHQRRLVTKEIRARRGKELHKGRKNAVGGKGKGGKEEDGRKLPSEHETPAPHSLYGGRGRTRETLTRKRRREGSEKKKKNLESHSLPPSSVLEKSACCIWGERCPGKGKDTRKKT